MRKSVLLLRELIILSSFLLFSLAASGQQTIVSGTVLDETTGELLIGVVVNEKGTQNFTTTDINGLYSINISPSATLVFSYLGYETQELAASSTSLNVRLKMSAMALDEVIVVGYGTVEKGNLTQSVSTVSNKEIDQRPIVSAAQAIQGKAAGVMVMQPNGTPGGELTIRVRGATSFNASNAPLYVVDGVPVENINFLSPNDIATMHILKDASSAAIYGSFAANGVIIITTKTGTSGKSKVTFNVQTGISKVANRIESLNAAQYKELQDEIGLVSVPAGTKDVTDWFDETYSTGITQNYQVSISNGSENFRYYLSAGYLTEKGVLNAAFFKRYSVRANVENQVRTWLNVSANVSYSDNISNGITTGQGSNRGGTVLSIVNLPTSVPIFNEAGLYNRVFYGMNIANPIEELANGRNNKSTENRLIASGSAVITFMPELTFKTQFTMDRRNAISIGFTPPSHGNDRDDWGSGWDNRNMNTVLTFDNVLTYKKSFDKHKIEAMLGSSWTDSDYTNSYISGSHYKDGTIHTLNAANKISWDGTGSGASQWAIMSYFGRIAYNFDDKYLFTANIRTDGSSKLHPDHRWGIFPSFSAAWRLSREKFMANIEWINDLKIRGGWGQTGNQSGIGDYAYLQRYNIIRQPWFEEGKSNAVPTIVQANLRTRDLTWETTSQTGIGIDLGILNGRLNFTVDYYYKLTNNMLMYVSLPSGSAAASSIIRNEGKMTNSGFEFSVNSHNLRGKFEWNTDFNISFNKNKLTSLALQQVYNDALTSDVLHETIVRNEPGRPLSGFFGYISDGVNTETGELMYRDINEDGKITATDRTYIGDPNPDFTFGLTNTFSWKNFNLSILIQGSYGNDIYNASRIETEGMYDGKNQSTRVLDRWRVPGQIKDVPKAGFDIKNSSYFVEDGSYLRLKNISLSYNFTGEFLKKIGITRLQPYVTVSNLLTWTKYSGMDPEVNQWGGSGAVQGVDWGTYPHSKSYVFGINIEF
ncbi:MAG: TonB-dependent receptor [Prevotellaceae bacterium]|jgi:TonB-linked SusC/RagA family outer membrane protein|nr:TonB-dependent receptor [Prevotellaceae bacterium]